MAFRNYNYQYVPETYVAPTYLNTLGNSLDTLQKRHNTTVEKATALKEVISQLPLNEAEDAYRQELANRVNTVLEENSVNGFEGFGYNNVIKLVGDIRSDKDLIGKLRNQEEYQKFMTSLDNSELPEQYKRYYKENNPYYTYSEKPEYQDITDEAGNTTRVKVSDNIWTPFKNPNQSLDYNTFFKEVMSYVKPDSGSNSVVEYLDANGNLTTDVSKAVTPVWHDIVTNSYSVISKDKIRNALQAAIDANPNALNSLKQDWEIAKWAIDNGETPLYNVMSKNNGKMTLQQFRDAIFEPFIRAAATSSVTQSNVKSNNNYATQVAKYNASSGGDSYKVIDEGLSGSISPSGTYKYTDETKVYNLRTLDEGNKLLSSELNKRFGYNKPVSITNLDAVSQELLDSGANPNEVAELIGTFRDSFAEDIRYYNQNFSNLNDKAAAASYTKNTLKSHIDFDSDNMTPQQERYYNEWTNMVDNYYGDGDVLMAGFTSNDGYKRLKSAIDDAVSKGIIPEDAIFYGNVNNAKGIGLKKEYANYLNEFGGLVQQAHNDSRMIPRAINTATAEIGSKMPFSNAWGNDIWQYDTTENKATRLSDWRFNNIDDQSRRKFGRFIETFDQQLLNGKLNRGFAVDQYEAFRPVGRFYDRLNADASTIENPDDDLLTTFKLTGGNYNEVIMRALAKAADPNDEDFGKYLNAIKTGVGFNQDDIKIKIPGSLQNSIVYTDWDDKGNHITEVANSEFKNLLNQYINQKNIDNTRVDLQYNPSTGKFLPSIIVTLDKSLAKAIGKESDEGKNITVSIDGISDDYIDNLNANPLLETFHELFINPVTNRDLEIPQFRYAGSNQHMYIHSDGGDSMSILLDNGAQDQTLGQFNIGSLNDSGTLNRINNSNFNDLVQLRELQKRMNVIEATPVGGAINENDLNHCITMYSRFYKSMFPNATEQEIARSFNSEIGKNLVTVE